MRGAALPIVADGETALRAWRAAIARATAHRLTLYLELSLRRQLLLVTFDTALRRAAAGVKVV